MLDGDPLRERVEPGPRVRGGDVHDEVARTLRDKGLDVDERDHLGELRAGREGQGRERGRKRLDDGEGQGTSDHRVAVASEAARVCPNVLAGAVEDGRPRAPTGAELGEGREERREGQDGDEAERAGGLCGVAPVAADERDQER